MGGVDGSKMLACWRKAPLGIGLQARGHLPGACRSPGDPLSPRSRLPGTCYWISIQLLGSALAAPIIPRREKQPLILGGRCYNLMLASGDGGC